MKLFRADFNLDAKYIGLNVAILNVGSIVGGPFGGIILDRLGRKRGLLVASLVEVIGAAIAGSATTGEIAPNAV